MIPDREGMIYRYRALSSRVLAVAVANDRVKDWAAYIDAVPGKNHDQEYMMASKTGERLPQNIAEILFPVFSESFKWRD